MKKLKMARGVSFTFEEGCNKYLENCRQRNLREGAISCQSQLFRKLSRHIIYGNIKTRYNAFSKTENDVFNEIDFAMQLVKNA